MCDLTIRSFSCCLHTDGAWTLTIHRWLPKMKSMWGTSITWSACETTGTMDLISDDPIGFSESDVTIGSTECSIFLLTWSESSMYACRYSSVIFCDSWLTLLWSILSVLKKLSLPWTCSLMSSLMSSRFTCGAARTSVSIVCSFCYFSMEGDDVDEDGAVEFSEMILILVPFHSFYNCALSAKKAMDVKK